MILLRNGNIASVNRMFHDDEGLELECQIWKKNKPLYFYPCNSMKFDICNAHNEPSSNTKIFSANFIYKKLVKLELSFTEKGPRKVYFIHFLH